MPLNLAVVDTWFQSRVLQQLQHDDVVGLLGVALAGLAYGTKGILWGRPDPYHYKLFEKPQHRLEKSQTAQRVDNLEKRLAAEDCKVAVLWASQSGTAERFAGNLAKELRRRFHAKAHAFDVSDTTPVSLMEVSETRVIIFIASTFGEGDPSDNMHQLWSWLRTNRDNSLSNIRFWAFGLGNSNYKHYNHVVDVLEAELLARGAKMLLETGKADDAHGETEEHFIDWKERVFDLFQTTLGYQPQTLTYEPCVNIAEDLSIETENLWKGSPYVRKLPSGPSESCLLPVIRSLDLLHDSPDRKCLHIEVETSGYPNLKYKTGDHLAIWPVNPAQEVNKLLNMLGLESKRATPILIKSLDSSAIRIPSPTTYQALFQSYLEICAPVSRENIEALTTFAPTTAAQELLNNLARDKTTHGQYLDTHYLNLGRLLTKACAEPGAWSSIPLSLVLEILPAMQPRFYSISSSSIVSPRQISITVAVSDTTSRDSPDRVIGLATNFLSSANGKSHPQALTYSQGAASGHVYAAVRKSTFKLPITASAPVIMIGAGTGVAPFRAFVQERARLRSIGRDVGNMRLYFGCRNRSQDLIYVDEFAQWSTILGRSFTMTTAVSRPTTGENKRYVQNAVTEDADEMCKMLLDDNAHFYICGSAAMARDVLAVVAKIIMAKKGWSEEEMKAFADRQKRQRRWFQDVWG